MSWRRECWMPALRHCKLVVRRCSPFENGTCRLSSPRIRGSAGVRGAFGVPPLCVEPGHFKFTIWLFVRRVGGEVSPVPERFRAVRVEKNGSDSIGADQALALDQGFVLDDDANAFFKTAENFAQLQVSEPPSQCADFDRSTGLFGAEEEVFGVNTTGGPTG
jgi:hypothetical protein